MSWKNKAKLSEAILYETFQASCNALGVHDLKLVWVPSKSRKFSGEVRDGVLYVYEADETKAVETMKHELVDFVLTSRLVNPLVGLVNLLIKSKEAEIYAEKEKIVDVLSKLLDC